MTKNYIIAVNENGQPFIAHAYDDARKYGRQNKGHKYIVRIREGRNWRYFYTMNEYYSYLRKVRKSDPKKFERISSGNPASIQLHPDFNKYDPDSDPSSTWSTKELDRIDRATDGRVRLIEKRYETALERYERIKKTKGAKPEDIRLAKKAYEEALDEYNFMRGIS